MKKMILVFTVICFCFASFSGIEAQQRKSGQKAKSKVAEQKPDVQESSQRAATTSQDKKGVELVILALSSASISEQEQGEDGQWRWGPPSMRLGFSEVMGKQFAIQALVGQKTMSCPLRYQDVAYFIENGKRAGRVAVSWYAGCPFEIAEPLAVSSNLEMRVENTIEIEDVQDNILFVSPTSARPLVFQGGQVFTGCEMFRNVVWVFKKNGAKFRAKDDTYVVKKAGATIKFSSRGIEMDGVEKKK